VEERHELVDRNPPPHGGGYASQSTLLDRLSAHKKISVKKMTIPVARAMSVW
jgi:hypothetical protein